MFDGSSISGWKGINESDMILMPDPAVGRARRFYGRDDQVNIALQRRRAVDDAGLRSLPALARNSRRRLTSKSTGIADAAYFGPENEFFVFDSVAWDDNDAGRVLQDRLRRRRLEHGSQSRGRQHGPPPNGQRRLLPGPAGRFAARHSLVDVSRARGDGPRRRKCTTTRLRRPASAKSA